VEGILAMDGCPPHLVHLDDLPWEDKSDQILVLEHCTVVGVATMEMKNSDEGSRFHAFVKCHCRREGYLHSRLAVVGIHRVYK